MNQKALENISVFKGFDWLRGQDLNLRLQVMSGQERTETDWSGLEDTLISLEFPWYPKCARRCRLFD